ncbi:hypothetical protein KL946_003958 [Ogataea haglerorum]|uniref:Oxidoreductase-like domain-containing protein n=1 Tax=Ogataea haglerorum TaxID=1937702 RepID=A0ABQ7RCE2_9ASCO|nr:hypothetical protein KL946_003958 [Ogataea haglerorum]
MIRICQKRLLSTSSHVFQSDKMDYYRLMAKSRNQKAKSDDESVRTMSLTFDTRPKTAADNADIDKIFGFSGKNKSDKSSRRDVSYRSIKRNIAGVMVPKRPIEPDNCCMSGCVNCVWELYGEDLEEWKQLTKLAAQRLMEQGDDVKEKWPVGFDPPPDYLPAKYIPEELREKNVRQEKRVEMPLGIQVFTQLEKKLKSKHRRQSDSRVAAQA